MDTLNRDVFACIVDFCEVNQNLWPLRLVCKSFYAAILPRVWCEVRKPRLDVLELLSVEGNQYAPHVRVLELVKERDRYRQDGPKPEPDIEAVRKFNNMLEGTLRNCRGLVEFTYDCETEYAFPSSFTPLAELTELTRLKVWFQSPEVADIFWGTGSDVTRGGLYKTLGVDARSCSVPLLAKNSNLTSLDIECTGALGNFELSIANIAQTLRNSTGLESLTLGMPQRNCSTPKQGYEWAFKDLCKTYSRVDGSEPLKLKGLHLRLNVYLTAADSGEGNYVSEMVDLEQLKEFSLFCHKSFLTSLPEPTDRFEDWTVMKPARNLEFVDICGITEGVRAFFAGNSDLALSLRKLDVRYGAQGDLVELLNAVKKPMCLVDLLFVCPDIIVSQGTVDAIVSNLPMLEISNLHMSPRVSRSMGLPSVRPLVEVLGNLQRLRVLELHSAQISYCWKWPGAISELMKQNQNAFPALEELTTHVTECHVVQEVPEGSSEPRRVLKEKRGNFFGLS